MARLWPETCGELLVELVKRWSHTHLLSLVFCNLLSRLGAEEVILVDCDVVSASNINRQVLFSRSDVGRRKVEAAVDGLRPHNIRTSESCLEEGRWRKRGGEEEEKERERGRRRESGQTL